MKHVFFVPWVGAEYSSGGIFGKRILVLGESHYGDGEPSADATRRVLEEYLDCPETVPSYLQSFKRFERSLTGAETDPQQRRRIWDSLLFYNFVQEVSTDAPRQTLDVKNPRQSADAFFEVLETYRPEYIIVWGYRLWDKLLPAEHWEWGEEIVVDGLPAIRFGYYTLADGTRVKAIPVKHPSAGYSWAEWNKILQSFLQMKTDLQNPMPVVRDNPGSEKPISDTFSKAIEDDTEINMVSDKIICRTVYSDLPADVLWNLFSGNIQGVIKEPYTSSITAEQLLPRISKAFREAEISWDKEECGYKRTVGIIDKLGRNTQLQHGQILISLYLNTYCDRGKEVHTQIENESAEHSFTEAPDNIDYQTLWDNSSELLKSGVIGECVFSIENKERAKEPFVLCHACKGSGKMKCPSCEGSGREQYVDGYYASGEERIKTGACSECSGSGKVDCPECDGQGKMEIFAPHYSVIRSVSETISQVACCAYTTPWESYRESCYVHDPDQSVSEFDPELSLSKVIQQQTNSDDFIRLRMKNRRTTAIDNTQRIIRTMTDVGVIDLYKKNESQTKEWFADTQRGAFVSQHARHYLLPISRLKMNLSKYDSAVIYLVPYKQDSTLVILPSYYSLPETGVLKYLFYKLFK